MTRFEAVQKIMRTVQRNDLVVVSTGYLCRDVYEIDDRPGNFYMCGSMGNAFGIGLGIALFAKRKVVVISGDGAALMNLGSLVLANYFKMNNLTHFIIDNNCYASTGGQPTCSRSFNFAQFNNTSHIKVDLDDPPSPRIPLTAIQIKKRFMKEISKNSAIQKMHETQQSQISRAREYLPTIEVAGLKVRCITSNIRVKDNVCWRDFQLSPGVGHEGNLILGEVVSLGSRREMEYLDGNKVVDLPLKPKDLIIGVLANRHSGLEEYGEVPVVGLDIGGGAEIDLLGAGGAMGICLGLSKDTGSMPTKVRTLGMLSHRTGRLVDLRDFYPAWETELLSSAPIVLSLGTASGIGKTTTAREIIRAVKSQGVEKVAATKIAGTGSKWDIALLADAGANPAFDFPDIGLPTTYTSPERFMPASYTLLNKLNREGKPDIIIAECGGDIIEANIPTLLQNEQLLKHVAVIIHSATDILSIIGSLSLYEKWRILNRIPIILTHPIKRNYYATKARLDELGIKLPIFDPLNSEETKTVAQYLVSLLKK